MNWFAAVPPILAAVAVFVLPGAPIALALGARGITAIALAVAGSVSAVAASAIIAPLVHVAWAAYVPFLLSLPLSLIIFTARRFWRRRFSPPPHDPASWRGTLLFAAMGLVLAAALIAVPLLTAIPHPDLPSQTYDDIFHLNAVRQILDTGNASTFALNLSAPMSSFVFYPAAWHDLTALVVQLSGVPIVVAANSMSLVIACFVWPVSCLALARMLFGANRLALVITGITSASFAAFPLLLIDYGVLYPNLLSYAILPAGLAFLVLAVGKARDADLDVVARWLVVPWLIGGIGIAHPNAVFALMVVGMPLIVHATISYVIRIRGTVYVGMRSAAAIAGTALALIACIAIWLKSGTSDNSWAPTKTVAGALGEGVFNGPVGLPPAIIVALLTLVGIVCTVLKTPRYRWLSVSFVLVIVLYVFASAGTVGWVRTLITGLWYNDAYRLAALLPVTAVPLAVLGSTAILDGLRARRAKTPQSGQRRSWVTVASVVVVFALLILSTRSLSLGAMSKITAKNYALTSKSVVLSPDEIAVFSDVAAKTPADSIIAGNPWDGSSLVYAYANRKTLFPHVSGSYPADRLQIAKSLSTDPNAVCAQLKADNVRYVLDFGEPYVFGYSGSRKLYPGFTGLSTSSAVSLIAHHGHAKLYKIIACGLG